MCQDPATAYEESVSGEDEDVSGCLLAVSTAFGHACFAACIDVTYPHPALHAVPPIECGVEG